MLSLSSGYVSQFIFSAITQGEEIVSQRTQAEPIQSSSGSESLPEDEESEEASNWLSHV
jgi:hypothetical protein